MRKNKGFNMVAFAIAFLFIILGSSFVYAAFHTENRYTYQIGEGENQRIVIQSPAPIPIEMNEDFEKLVNDCLVPVASLYGYTLRVSADFRTMEEQDAIYNQGRTVDGHIVTEAPAGRSIHNYGYAVDVVDRWRGYEINWDKLSRIGSFCGLEHDDEVDFPHFEIREGLTTDDFMYGKRPPVPDLPCTVMQYRADTGEKLTLSDLRSCDAPNFNLNK